MVEFTASFISEAQGQGLPKDRKLSSNYEIWYLGYGFLEREIPLDTFGKAQTMSASAGEGDRERT